MRRLVLMGLLASVCAAGDRFSHEAKDETLASVTARLNEYFGFTLTLGDGLGGVRVSLSFREATAPQALRALADAAKVKLYRLAPGRYRIGESERERILAALDGKTLNVVNFKSALKTACRWIRSATGTPSFVDPRVETNPTVLIESRMSTREGFDTITQQANLAWDVRYGVVFIATKERLEALPRDNPFRTLGVPDVRVSLRLNNSNLRSAAAVLSSVTGVEVKVDPADRDLAGRKITIHATDIRFVDALALLAVPNGLTVVKADEGLVVKAPAK